MSVVVMLILGLGVGWLANWLGSRFVGANRFGLMGDLVAGTAGALIGGLVASSLIPGPGVGAVAITLLGACALVSIARLALMVAGERLNLWGEAPVTPLSESVRQRLTTERGLSVVDASPLRMMQERGEYAGRTVTYFQVFDPTIAVARGADLRHSETINPQTFLHSGFIERDGTIVLNDAPRKPVVAVSAAAI